jgi:hypothetical protein
MYSSPVHDREIAHHQPVETDQLAQSFEGLVEIVEPVHARFR